MMAGADIVLLVAAVLWSHPAPAGAGAPLGAEPEPGNVTRVSLDIPDGPLVLDLVEGPHGSWLRARGVQYAEHPVGRLRFQPPVPKPAWGPGGPPVNATAFGKECYQGPPFNRLIGIGFREMSEACLFLNVYAPRTPRQRVKGGLGIANGRVAAESLPVLLWIHGGSFAYGGSAGYNGDRIMEVRRDVIVITVNYRVGSLGFLGGKAVQETTTDKSSGNFGLQDTREALRWVRRNIGAFGGDRDKITIFGESAGASLVACHLVAPRSAGLFRGAIMQSGAFDNYTVQADAEASFDAFAREANCTSAIRAETLLCLRFKPLPLLEHAIGNTSADGACQNQKQLTHPTSIPRFVLWLPLVYG